MLPSLLPLLEAIYKQIILALFSRFMSCGIRLVYALISYIPLVVKVHVKFNIILNRPFQSKSDG